MADIGLNQNLEVGSRRFHIQTATNVEDGSVRSEIFEEGKLLYVENSKYERRNSKEDLGIEPRLRTSVDKLHRLILHELDSLFEISEILMQQDDDSPNEKIGLVFLHMRIFDKAEIHFKRVISLNPERFSSYIYLARCYFMQGRTSLAYKSVTELLNRKVDYADLHNLMGLILMEKKRYVNAFKYFQLALKKNPSYTEVYLNLTVAILLRIQALKEESKDDEIEKTINFLKVVLKKVERVGGLADRQLVNKLLTILKNEGIKKALSILHKYKEDNYVRKMPAEIVGYEFFLRLRYLNEELTEEVLDSFEEKIANELERNSNFPDLWNYLALIHLMQCRLFFLKGLGNFKESTRINPNFEKAQKNLRLVENDGREFLTLINALV